MKVLALTRYGRLGASSRVRFYQYQAFLAAQSIDIDWMPLFSDAYVRGLQGGQRSVREVASAYASRAMKLVRNRGYDLLWIEKDALPWLPAWVEQALLGANVPCVLDYDDAVFHAYDGHRSLVVRRLLGGKHRALMRAAALVVAGNRYLADYALASGASKVEVVPTVVDLARYPEPGGSAGGGAARPVVGWIGQRATARFLQPLAPVFRKLAEEGVADFAAIGIDAAEAGLPMRSVPWSEDTEVKRLRDFDIGIMPLADGPFERGKCGYKLIQYMACGLPVIASPVGVNQQIVVPGQNGFHAVTLAEWDTAVRALAGDAAMRRRMGMAGRQQVERHYSLQVAGPRLADLLRAASA
jgi:glycosyltransferase involved in cell wall biosynthesis